MEFPRLGENCSFTSCKQLDFLPVKCDACQRIYCKDHYFYQSHQCAYSYAKNNQVPVCPLCNQPVPIKPGFNADDAVGQHIDNDCRSDAAETKRKVYNNRCAYKGCKQKEMVPVICEKCRNNYCLKHRLEMDHSCQGYQNSGRTMSKEGATAILRTQGNNTQQVSNKKTFNTPSRTTAIQVNSLQQPGISEDEAIKIAMEMSLKNNSNNVSSQEEILKQQQEEEDAQLAIAILESENAASIHRHNHQTSVTSASKKQGCSLS